MTRDEAKQLLGGYATGSLTESERKALFEAALDDEELFEELAGEQELAEILALPGAKQRLAAALTSAATASEGTMATNAPEEKKKRAWWLFALAGVASVALLVWLTTSSKTDAPVEVAVQKTAPSDLPDSKSDDSKLKEPETSAALDALARSEREKSNTTTVEEKKAAPKKSEVPTARSKPAGQGQQGQSGAVANPKQLRALASAPAPAPPPAKAPAGNGFLPGAAGGAVGGFADNSGRVQLATPAVAEAQIAQARGGAGGAKGGAAAVRADAAPVRAGALSYILTGRGSLKVTPAVSGSLEVTAGDRHIIGWDPVVADSTVEMPVPSGVDSLTLRFAIPGQQPQVVQIPIRQ